MNIASDLDTDKIRCIQGSMARDQIWTLKQRTGDLEYGPNAILPNGAGWAWGEG